MISLSRILPQTSTETVRDICFSSSSSSAPSKPALLASSVLATIELASRANCELARMASPSRRKIIGIGSRPNAKKPKSETAIKIRTLAQCSKTRSEFAFSKRNKKRNSLPHLLPREEMILCDAITSAAATTDLKNEIQAFALFV